MKVMVALSLALLGQQSPDYRSRMCQKQTVVLIYEYFSLPTRMFHKQKGKNLYNLLKFSWLNHEYKRDSDRDRMYPGPLCFSIGETPSGRSGFSGGDISSDGGLCP